MEFDRAVFDQRLGQYDADQVVAAAGQLAAGHGFILDELHRCAVHPGFRELEVARELQHHGALPGAPGREREFGFAAQLAGRLHLHAQHVVGHFKAGMRGRIFFTRSLADGAHGKGGPGIVKGDIIDYAGLRRADLLGDVCIKE